MSWGKAIYHSLIMSKPTIVKGMAYGAGIGATTSLFDKDTGMMAGAARGAVSGGAFGAAYGIAQNLHNVRVNPSNSSYRTGHHAMGNARVQQAQAPALNMETANQQRQHAKHVKSQTEKQQAARTEQTIDNQVAKHSVKRRDTQEKVTNTRKHAESTIRKREEQPQITRNLEELGPVPEGYVRLTHTTRGRRNLHAEQGIREQGLKYKHSVDTTTVGYRETKDMPDAFNRLGDLRFAEGDMYLFDVPIAEHRVHQGRNVTKEAPGFIPKEYLKGIIEAPPGGWAPGWEQHYGGIERLTSTMSTAPQQATTTQL